MAIKLIEFNLILKTNYLLNLYNLYLMCLNY